ncbi:MAG: Dabb family protein [Pseudaminobacter sp.]
MIRHIVFFSVKPDHDVETVREALRVLGTIPHSSHFEVTVNSKVDPMCDRIDIVVYAEFPDAAALAAYKAHPTYMETTRKVRPMRELRFSADVEAEADQIQRRTRLA